MTQQTFALLTNKGRAKEAASLAGGTGIVISHIAIGSGETVPSGGETKLYKETLRKAITGHGLVTGTENTAYFDIFLSAEEGPFTIREAGLYDSDGDLIAIAHYDPPINKPTPDSGQTVEGIIRIEVAFSNVANIIIKVDPSLNVALQRLTTTPWIAVKAVELTAPPVNPNIGDCYIIANNATGLWLGQESNLAEFTQAGWAIMITPNGHGVGLPDGRIFTKANGTYVEKIALDNQSGKWHFAETQGTANALIATLKPATLSLVAGMTVKLKIKQPNTNAATLNLNGFGAKPIVYHETGEPLVGDDFQTGDVVNLVFDGANWRLQPSLAYMDKRYSRLAPPPTDTYYVLPEGNDNNTGFAANAKEGFATIQGAIDAISLRYSAVNQIKIIVSPGTYGGFTISQSFITSWLIISSTANASDVIVDASSLFTNTGRACILQSGTLSLSYITFKAYYECVAVSTSQAYLSISSVTLILSSPAAIGIGAYGGTAKLSDSINIVGSNGISAIKAISGGFIRLGYYDAITRQEVLLGFENGNLNLSDATMVAEQSGSIEIFSGVFGGHGYPTARKFLARINGSINVFGGGKNFIPGNTAGSTESGGQYV